jgi:hypothetical protein
VARWSYVAYGPDLATQQARKLEFYWSGSLEAPERATCTRSRNISTLKRRPVPKSGAGSGPWRNREFLFVLRVPPNPNGIQPGDTFVETSIPESTMLGESKIRAESKLRRAPGWEPACGISSSPRSSSVRFPWWSRRKL